MALPGVNVSVEAVIENQIQEVTLDGQEIYVPTLSMSENLTKLANKIDFYKDESEEKGKPTSEGETEAESDKVVFQPSLWPWDSVRSKLKTALTETNVLLDVLNIAKEKRYMVLDPVPQEPPDSRPAVHLLAKKNALTVAADILKKGAERLRKSQSEMSRSQLDFHFELLKLRQLWRLRKVGKTILGDLSYKSAGSRFWQGGTFEVTKSSQDASDLSDSHVAQQSSLEVIIPSELEGVSYIQVEIRQVTDSKELSSASFKMPSGLCSAVATDAHWQQKLEVAQNVLFCKELFSQLARESVHLKSAIPHVVIGKQIITTIFPGVQLSIVLCHFTGKEKRAPSTIYRQNLKESNKKVYTEYLLQQKERSQQYRKRIKADPEKQRQQKENAKLRQRKFREKLKNESQKIPASTETKDNLKRRTRGETVLQRQKWCDAKRKYRKNLTSYKKVWIKRKDRLRKLGKKQKSAQEKPSPKGYQSMKTLYNVTSKVRKSLPESPQKFASVIKNLVQNTTPRKREAVKQTMEMHAIKKPRLEEDLPLEMESQSSLAEKAENESSEILEVEVMSDSRSKEQSRRHTCTCVKKLQQRYQIPARTISLVKSFFMREDISTPLPQKCYANKHGPGYVMQVTLYAAFSLLKKEYKECKIGFTKFTTLRPKNVRLLSASHWNYCVCTVCQNVSYKLKCLKRYLPGKIGDFDQLLNSILCTKGDGQRFHLPECIFKSCSKCKDTKLKLLVHLSSCEISDLLVTWNHWEKMVEDGKTRRILKSKRSSMSSMIEEMIQDIMEPVQSTSFAEHLFIGQWQRRQFTELKRSLPTDCVLFVMDFGKNRTVRYQDEPKSVFFTAQQITIHPVVIFYWSPDVAHLIVRHSLVFLSDDHLHDYHAVDHFFEKSVEYVKEIGIHFTKLIIFSDGCAAQYKGKGSFADLSLKNIHVERNYFGSDHGKSECDGELGCINRAVDMAILGRKVVVSCAEDMYTWCSASNLSLNEAGSKRRFFLVEKSDINRERDDTKVATLRGCRKLHQFLNIPSSPFHLLVKKLSCYCTNCRNGLTEQCPNRGYTGDFESRILRVCSSVQRTKPILQMPKACSSTSIRQMRKTPAVKPSELTSQLRQTRSIVQPIETIPQLRKARSYMPPKARSSAQPTKSSSKTPKAGSTVQPDKSSQQPMKSSPQMCKTSSYIQPTGTRSTPQMPKAPSYPQPTMDCLTLQAVKSTPKTPKTFAGNKASGLVLWEKLGSCNTYNDLQQIVVETEQPHLPELPDITFVSHKRVIDESALGLIPEELKNSGLFPSIVYGDGNCLPRCASLLAYGHEENHNEMRSRIIAELVRNEDKYLDDKFLTKGSNPNAHSNIAKQFAMFSDHYTAEKLTNLAVQRIFREEVLGACQSGKYMGIWQIAALANILETDIVSVYPLYGGKTVRKDLNRTFMPFHSSKVQRKEVYIMWSNVHGINVTENDWRPNHFVPLLKTFSETSMSRTVEGEVLQGLSPIAEYAFDDDTELSPVADYAFDDDAQDFLDSSLVNNIIQGLDDIPEEGSITPHGGDLKHNHVLEHSLHQLLREFHYKSINHPTPHPVTATFGMSKRRRLAGPQGFSRRELLEMTESECLLEQIIKQTQHVVLRLRARKVIDNIAVTVSDPLMSSHWSSLNSSLESSVSLHMPAHGYESARHKMVIQIGTDSIKCICRDGTIFSLGFEERELHDLLLWQISQHHINALSALSKMMSWQVLSSSMGCGVGNKGSLGTVSTIMMASMKSDRVVSVRSCPTSGLQVFYQTVPKNQESNCNSTILTDPKWQYIAGPFQEVNLDMLEGKNFANKMELLMSSLSTS